MGENGVVDALEQALEFIEDQEDVLDGDDGMPRPNRSMSLADILRDALPRARAEHLYATRWLAIRRKIRAYGEFEGRPAWYIDGQVIGTGDNPDVAIDYFLAQANPPRPGQSDTDGS